MPRKSEPAKRRRSAGLAAAKMRWSTSSGRWPSSSYSTFSRAPVTKSGGPTGRQPCATTVSSARSPASTTPTAPARAAPSPRKSRLPPGCAAPEAMPPIVLPLGKRASSAGIQASRSARNGSTSRITCASSGPGSSTSALAPRWNGWSDTPGSEAASAARPGPSSSSRPAPSTLRAVQPSSSAPGSSRRTRSATLSHAFS